MACQGNDRSCSLKKINELTQNLCYLCGTLIEKGLLGDVLNPRIKEWWETHITRDEERVRRQLKDHYGKSPDDAEHPGKVADGFAQRAMNVHPVSNWHKAWFVGLASDEAGKFLIGRAERESALSKLSPQERKAIEK